MPNAELEALATEVERSADLPAGTAQRVADAVARLLPAGRTVAAADLGSTDTVLHLADDALPDWSIKLKGRTTDRNGHWTCTLRQSDTFDNDMLIGIGKGPVLRLAVLAALVRLAAGRG